MILIIEDMQPQRDQLQGNLVRDIPGTRVEAVTTEEEFYEWLAKVVENDALPLPDIVVIDIMLPYRRLKMEDFGPNPRPLPENAPTNQAGFRCARRLRDHPRTSKVPFIFLSAIPPDLIQAQLGEFPDVILQRKENDHRALIQQITKVLQKRPGGVRADD